MNFLQGGQPLGSEFLSTPQMKPGNPHRARQLSVVFHEYITGLISNGEVCPELLDHGFEIVKVQMPPDLSAVNVYWLASGSQKDDEVAALLPKCASALRSTLTGLRLTGHVPPIQFCKDLTYARVQKVEELLKIADMGPDFEPSDEIDMTEIANPVKTVNQESINQKMQLLAKRFNQYSESESQQKSFGPASDLFHISASTCSELDDPISPKELSTTNSQSQSGLPVGEFSQLNLRSDLYGIPHDELKQKILQAKRKMQDRSCTVNSEETDGLKEEVTETREVSKTKAFTSEQLASVKYGNRRKDRLYRNADIILSSVHHKDNDNCKQNTEETFVDDEDYDDKSHTN